MQKLAGYSQIQSTGARVASATITVYQTGTLTLATIYADNLATPLSNPFTSDANGLWMFYAANGRYDVQISGGSPIISPAYTLSDFLLDDPLATHGTWTPIATGLVSTGGSPTITGSYSISDNLLFFTITVAPVGDTSAIANITNFTLPPSSPPIRPAVCVATGINTQNLGTGIIFAPSAVVYPPAWTGLAVPVYISGVYELT